MDLDKIKTDWQQATPKSIIDEEKINRMVGNEGKSAFNYIVKYCKVSMISLPLLALYPLLVPFFRFPTLIIFYCGTCFVGFLWECYKFRMYKSVDMVKMNILDISRFYIRLRKYIIYEAIVMVVWFISYSGLFIIFEYKYTWNEEEASMMLPASIAIFSIGFVLTMWICWKIYWKKIRILGNSIREVEEFERDNL